MTRARSQIRLYRRWVANHVSNNSKKYRNPQIRDLVWQLALKVEYWADFGIHNTLTEPSLEELGVILGYRPTLIRKT